MLQPVRSVSQTINDRAGTSAEAVEETDAVESCIDKLKQDA